MRRYRFPKTLAGAFALGLMLAITAPAVSADDDRGRGFGSAPYASHYGHRHRAVEPERHRHHKRDFKRHRHDDHRHGWRRHDHRPHYRPYYRPYWGHDHYRPGWYDDGRWHWGFSLHYFD